MAAPPLAMVPRDKYGNDSMSLSEFGLNVSIRTYRSGGRLRFSKIDVAKAITGKNNNDAGMDIRRLPEGINAEIDKDSVTHKFKGPGQQDTPTITYTGTLKLAMALPGETAKVLRARFADVLMRFFAGDASLVAEIERNRTSTNPINETAREAFEEESTGAGAGAGDKRKVPEAETITLEQVKGCFDAMRAAMLNDFKNQRRLTLGDDRRDMKKKEKDAEIERKRLEDAEKVRLDALEKEAEIERKRLEAAENVKLDAKQKDINMDLHKLEAEYELRLKRLAVEQHYADLEDRKLQRDFSRMDKEAQMKAAAAAAAAAAAPEEPVPTGPLTARNVGEFYGVYQGVSTMFVIRISNVAADKIRKPPHNIEPIGFVEDKLIGKTHPHFAAKHVKLMQTLLEQCKKAEAEYANIYT